MHEKKRRPGGGNSWSPTRPTSMMLSLSHLKDLLAEYRKLRGLLARYPGRKAWGAPSRKPKHKEHGHLPYMPLVLLQSPSQGSVLMRFGMGVPILYGGSRQPLAPADHNLKPAHPEVEAYFHADLSSLPLSSGSVACSMVV